jgi:hypothetical protein
MANKTIKASAAQRPIIALAGDVQITAAESDNGPKKFEVLAYTGGALRVAGYDRPVVVDLSGMTFGKSIIANLDHDSSKRVGHVVATDKSNGQLKFTGYASAATAARDEVVNSAASGFVWQASIEANPTKLVPVEAGKTVEVNGQTFEGPIYVARKSVSKGFGFVTHGADDNTVVQIAATAETKEKSMDPELKAWIEKMGFDADSLSETQLAGLKANYAGQKTPVGKAKGIEAGSDPFAERKAERDRREAIREIADKFMEMRPDDIEAIEKLHDHAIEAKMSAKDFRLEMYECSLPTVPTVFAGKRDTGLTSSVLEAAICQAGRLRGHEEMFDDKTLQAAHTQFKGNIGLKQLFLLAAEANGHRAGYSSEVNRDVLQAAFHQGRPIHAAGFSTISIATILSNNSNKFLMDGWNSVDQTCLRISARKSVNDFKTNTTVSLVDNVIYEQVGPGGEIKHGTLSEITYTNKVDTYAKMLAITRQDIINDDLGALTVVPRKLGNGAMKKLNDIFWKKFLLGVSTNFFGTTNKNINEGVATMTVGGLAATEVIFMNQTNPDGTPLGVMPAILLAPTALKTDALTLMNSQYLIDGTSTAKQGSANVFNGRWTVESSPYISNTAYTGATSIGYWLLANPMEMAVIEIAALNGRLEPQVDTAEADFNTLGVQMRGYSDVGVTLQEYRGGVYADGGSS